MHQAVNVQFERAVGEFVRWRAVPEDERSPAPAWWWGPAFEILSLQQPMELANGASYTAGAEVFLHSLEDQISLPWPDDFPRRPRHSYPT
jgi:hypothetical protein